MIKTSSQSIEHGPLRPLTTLQIPVMRVTLTALLAAAVATAVAASPSTFPWYNTSLSRQERVQALVSAMDTSERILWCVPLLTDTAPPPPPQRHLLRSRVFFVFDRLNDEVPAIPRLGLPAYSWEAEVGGESLAVLRSPSPHPGFAVACSHWQALHGVAWAGVGTIFPEPIALGASWDVPLVSEIANAIAVEARAKFVDGLSSDGSSVEFKGLSFMTPNNNLFVDPRWGRGQETYGALPCSPLQRRRWTTMKHSPWCPNPLPTLVTLGVQARSRC